MGSLVDKQLCHRCPADKAPDMGPPVDSRDGKSNRKVNSDGNEYGSHPNPVAPAQYQDRTKETEDRARYTD